MRNQRLSIPIGLFFSLLCACGGSSTDGGTTGTGGSPGTQNHADELTFETGLFEVPPGESFECFYLDRFTERELSVVSADGNQAEGGHHILVYWSDIEKAPSHSPCVDAEMASWHQIAGAGGPKGEQMGGAEGAVGLPEGLALKVPAGKQLVMQAHYINTSGKPQQVNDWVKLNVKDPSEIEAYANYFAVLDDSFEVPAQNAYTSTTVCTVDRDLQTVLVLGHMHEYGKHYKMERLDDKGSPIETIYEREWSPEFTSHPPVETQPIDAPRVLAKGTKLRQTCTWNNTTSDPLLFPREMCVGFFYYYPDEGEIVCNAESVP